MRVRWDIPKADLSHINRRRGPDEERVTFDELTAFANDALKILGARGTCTVGLIRSHGDPCAGTARVPLQVAEKRGRYVIKPYDDYDPAVERAVLTRVQGTIAPPVLSFGDDFYAEALIDHDNALSLLDSTVSKPFSNILEWSARGFANLARLGINYRKHHWMDEFHLAEDGLIITDFGGASCYSDSDEALAPINKEGFLDYAKRDFDFAPTNSLESLLELNADSSTFVHVVESLIPAYSQLFWYVSRFEDERDVPVVLQAFIDFFVDAYNNGPPQQKYPQDTCLPQLGKAMSR